MAATVDEIEREILAGLPNSLKRLDDALYNLEFYNGDFSRFPPRPPGEDNSDRSRKRHSLVMQRVVNVLTSNLYRAGPKRTVEEHDRASTWLEEIYRRNAADALWQQGDRWTVVSDVAAIQVEPTTRPERPVRLRLWDASQFEVWTSPDEPTEPIAVAVLDKYDHQRRLRLWTADETRVYLTAKLAPGQTTGGTAYRRVETYQHALGVVPFAFAHFNPPLCDFWAPGPGNYLRSVNDVANAALTNGFDAVSVNLLPVLLLENVQPGFAPKAVRPGAIWDLPGRGGDITREASTPKASYLQANPSFIAASWEDLANYLDHVLEMLGIPLAAVRMVQDSGRSGVSIVAEQIPLINWAESRQRPFAGFEQALASLVLRVGARHLAAQGLGEYQATAAELFDAANAPLSLRWPDLYPALPGPETDQADQWLLDNAMASRVTIAMRRWKLTRQEAEAYLAEVAEDVRRDRESLGAPRPSPADPASSDVVDDDALDDDDDHPDHPDHPRDDQP